VKARALDEFDRHLFQFFLTWAPFGGPADEDTFPRFGFDAASGRRRFERVATAACANLRGFCKEDAALVLRASKWVAAQPQDVTLQTLAPWVLNPPLGSVHC
jgi:hypothetical protein